MIAFSVGIWFGVALLGWAIGHLVHAAVRIPVDPFG